MKNGFVEEIYEQRRLDLKALVDSMGRGSIARIAAAIDVEPNYVSRLLYPAGKSGKKSIGDEIVIKLDKAYPLWRKRLHTTATKHEAAQDIANYCLNELQAIAADLPIEDRQKLLGLAIHLKKENESLC